MIDLAIDPANDPTPSCLFCDASAARLRNAHAYVRFDDFPATA
ncbi:MAG: hypothetical protein ABR553_03310 [Gammaproteobacteria bacterium]